MTLCSFSHSGGVLCGVGKDRHGKSQVVVWNTSRVTHSGEVCVLARAHTDVSIERMRVAGFDDSRYINNYYLLGSIIFQFNIKEMDNCKSNYIVYNLLRQ